VRGFRLRRDRPDSELKGGISKVRAKYLSPAGQPNFFYVPPNLPPGWTQDASLPIVMVEGEKKTLAVDGLGFLGLGDAAEKPRFVTIGISGAWCWKGHRQANGIAEKDTQPIADFDHTNWKDREVTLWSDANFNTNDNVRDGWRQLARELKKRGAIVRYTHEPTLEGLRNRVEQDSSGFWYQP
jgi:Domain of unknown function (DUF3854)